MALSALSIVTKGIGFGAVAVALSGFADVSVTPPASPPQQQYTMGAGGSSFAKATIVDRPSPNTLALKMLRQDDEMVLEIIMAAVTGNLL